MGKQHTFAGDPILGTFVKANVLYFFVENIKMVNIKLHILA